MTLFERQDGHQCIFLKEGKCFSYFHNVKRMRLEPNLCIPEFDGQSKPIGPKQRSLQSVYWSQNWFDHERAIHYHRCKMAKNTFFFSLVTQS
jgi:hypothetical protein